MGHINKEKQICKVLSDFLSLERIAGECIGQAILKFYEDRVINIIDCREQCSNGAPNMQSLKKQLQATIYNNLLGSILLY